MYSYALLGLLAVAEARFGQEQVPIPAIAALKAGAPGVAQTIAGAAVSDLLAASNACAKLKRGDQIIQQLGTGADVVAAAIGMIAAEKNFNPFVASIPAICNDPTLPVTNVLRGITPLIDPAVGGAAAANALSAKTKTTPLNAVGMSVADLLSANGFTNFTTQGSGGAAGAAPASPAAAPAATPVAGSSPAPASTATTPVAVAAGQCAAQVAAALSSASAAGTKASAAPVVASPAAASTTASAAAAPAAATPAANTAGANFGTCNPTIKFEGGLGGRPATEFTFQSQDPAIIAVQQEALNPNIITNRICDSLTNFCGANAQAKTVCLSAKAQILALGTRDVTTAQKWNALVGSPGVSTNPDGGPAAPGLKAKRTWKA